MEKMNFINVIVSILLIAVGSGFCLFAIHANTWNGSDIICMIMGILLIAYGLLRIYLTNKSARDI